MSNQVDINYLVKMQQHINDTKATIDRLTGRLEAAQAGLKELGFTSVEDAEKERALLEASIHQLENEFRQVIEQIETLYKKTLNWR